LLFFGRLFGLLPGVERAATSGRLLLKARYPLK
jgi:hypothetical protein